MCVVVADKAATRYLLSSWCCTVGFTDLTIHNTKCKYSFPSHSNIGRSLKFIIVPPTQLVGSEGKRYSA